MYGHANDIHTTWEKERMEGRKDGIREGRKGRENKKKMLYLMGKL